MAEHVCPWWLGYLLASPVRRLMHNQRAILGPLVKPGMTVVEPGCGMGYFSLPIARMVGADGRVVCVDVQEKMLAGLIRRAERAGLLERLEARLCSADSLAVEDLNGMADFVLAFAFVHEVADAAVLFGQFHHVLKPGGLLLVAEPAGRVSEAEFQATIRTARDAGLSRIAEPEIPRSLAAVMQNEAA